MGTAFEKVGTGLGLLRDGLAPFVEREIYAAVRAGRLTADQVNARISEPVLRERRISEWDAAPLLRVTFELWNEAFRERLSPTERSLVAELRGWRNRWAHQEPIGDDDADRILDTIERLLGAIGASEAGRVNAIKEQLRRERYGGLMEPAPPPAQNVEPRGLCPPRPMPIVGWPAGDPAVERPFDIVCWMKPEEARVIVEAFASEADRRAVTSTGNEVEARWFAADDPDARRFRSQVCLVRHRRSGLTKRFWIRREEAEAVLRAYAAAGDVEFGHAEHGIGGRAVFHADGTPLAQKFLANIMLVRYR